MACNHRFWAKTWKQGVFVGQFFMVIPDIITSELIYEAYWSFKTTLNFGTQNNNFKYNAAKVLILKPLIILLLDIRKKRKNISTSICSIRLWSCSSFKRFVTLSLSLNKAVCYNVKQDTEGFNRIIIIILRLWYEKYTYLT